MTEGEFQKRITDLCDWLGLKWHHETDSRRTRKGWPDLVICGPEKVIIVELKSPRGKVTKEQHEWLISLSRAGISCYVWRPDDWEFARRRLMALAGR